MKKPGHPPTPDQQLVLFTSQDGAVSVQATLNRETVWLTQEQMAQVFAVKRPAVTKHLRNIFQTNELDEGTTCSILEHTAVDGKTYATQYYNLDAIIAVGYRVNSKRATQFRIWATDIPQTEGLPAISRGSRRIAPTPPDLMPRRFPQTGGLPAISRGSSEATPTDLTPRRFPQTGGLPAISRWSRRAAPTPPDLTPRRFPQTGGLPAVSRWSRRAAPTPPDQEGERCCIPKGCQP
jgi:hypothetical protein